MSDEPRSNPPAEATPPDDIRLSMEGTAEPALRRYENDALWQGLEGEDRHFQYYLAVLYKRRWIAITALLVVLTFAINRNFTAVPVYEASVRVLLDAERLNLVNVEDVIDQRRPLDTELAILRSRWLAAKTVASLGLIQNEPVAGRGAGNGVGKRDGQAGKSGPDGWWSAASLFVSRAFGGFPPPPRAAEPLAGERPAEAPQISAFLGGLSLAPTANGVLDIKYRSSDPVLAARFANAHAQEYINENLEMRVAAVREVTGWLTARLAEQKEKLDASEQALEHFREQNQLITAEGSPIVMARLNELSASITRAQTGLFDKEASYNRALALRANPDKLDQLPQMLNNAALQQLRLELERLRRDRATAARTLRAQHPSMLKLEETIQATQAKLDVERSRVLEAMREDLGVSRAAEANLGKELESLKIEATAQNRKNVELSILTREVASNRQIYDMFMQRARETGVAKDINPSRIRILDAATVPSSPVGPDKGRSILGAVFAGLGLALVLAFGFEYLDNRIKLPEEIGQRLGLPVLGFLPEIKLKSGVTGPLATNGVPPEFSEELRRIRTNLVFSFAGDATRSVVITSASPTEGKTVVGSNLAVALAQAGERVLLMDADLRRPMIHTHFAFPQEPGLSNVLVSGAKAGEVVRRSAVANLWVLPAGRCPPNPSELLGSYQFRKFLAALGQHFDWIVIDTPPVMAVTDACVVGHAVTGTLFVVGADMVSRRTARRAVEQLMMANAKVIGGVLSRVDPGRFGQYYSSYYRGNSRKYRDYYKGAASA
ncbi:MAG: hypothetical protein A3H96_00590 [Acidobacteria bacterium RIFCSPLOWO2_02_FULL_67_36]|nr:MAG: hypothetical protein A3H96_00590 [Acidobacteria bacterium RIFCSPLOWO2_02_FULL_67_36]OFW23088.1 MAG: hypothetical protein A3G21_00760 [Acidobacteria bacterium RIFCSPLOWO2_12_FULL_66_21]